MRTLKYYTPLKLQGKHPGNHVLLRAEDVQENDVIKYLHSQDPLYIDKGGDAASVTGTKREVLCLPAC